MTDLVVGGAEDTGQKPVSPLGCPICHSEDQISECCTVNGYHVFSCAVCQGDFVSPTPSSDFLKEFYSREAWFEGGEPGGYKSYDQQTVGSVQALEHILIDGGPRPGSVLDVGCGYGSHLELAARSGWNCFGIEISAHARAIAQQRLAGKAIIRSSLAELSGSAYQLVLLLDVIEHLGDPWVLFRELAQHGAFDVATKIVVTTPNAQSDEARQDPEGWQFRHPPSHLTYYSAAALETFLSRIGFSHIDVSGVHPTRPPHPNEDGVSRFAGLLATASGFANGRFPKY